MSSRNIEMIETVVRGLGVLSNDVVFVGGSVAELYAQNVFAEDIRPTEDVDIVVNLLTRQEFYHFEDKLRKSGFQNDTSFKAPICRWLYQTIKVDIMPCDSSILGFSNKWYTEGIKQKISVRLPAGSIINLFTPTLYICSKLEAVLSRGISDIRLSHDFEDIIFIIDNCELIDEDILKSKVEIQNYLKTVFTTLSKLDTFHEAVECALPLNAQNRAAIISDKIKGWATNSLPL